MVALSYILGITKSGMQAVYYNFAGILTIYHTRVQVAPVGVSFDEVVGVAVLDLNGPIASSHIFDCYTTNGTSDDLVWEKEEGMLRFPAMKTSITIDDVVMNVFRMDMGPTANTNPVGEADLGEYTCTNTLTGERKTVNISGGMML